MSFEEKAKRKVAMNPFVENDISGHVLEDIELDARRKSLWALALQRSRSNEQRAKALYLEYRDQSIKAEAAIALALSEEPSAAIIQRYMAKVEKREPEKNSRQNIPNNLMPKGYHKKKCYKCGKVVSLAVKPCPDCCCNSYVFCD